MDSQRDRTKQYVKDGDGFIVITFWQPEIKGVAQAGWVHKVEDKK